MTRILISAGGTGGGVYPALVVAEALRQSSDVVLHFVSSTTGLENELLEKTDVRLDEWDRVAAGPLHGVNPIKFVRSLLRLVLGISQSARLLRQKKPAAIFLTGGWVGLPVALAGWLYRLPMVIYVPDIEPGRTLKLLGRFATAITATSQDTERYYPANRRIIETGYPVRQSLFEATREAGIQHFGLDSAKRTLLIFGGSRGSRAINEAILSQMDQLMAIPDLQILHISGKLDANDVQAARQKLSVEFQARYHLYDYVDEMGLALAAADLVINRAGASILGEFPVFGLPSILIPLAYSWRYQEVNADWLVERGAAIRLDEPQIDELAALVQHVFSDHERLTAMQASAKALKTMHGAANIAQVILDMAE